MLKINTIGQERLRQLFCYEDGKMFWKERPSSDFKTGSYAKNWNGNFAGKEAGGPAFISGRDKPPRYHIGIDRQYFYRSHIVWVFHNGDIRDGFQIDHINCDSTDDRIENLRLATPSQNTCNRRKQSNNTSGFKCISYEKSKEKWILNLSISFDSKEEAVESYKRIVQSVHGEFARTE